MSETPRTDQASRRGPEIGVVLPPWCHLSFVDADFARKLERELAAVTRERDEAVAWIRIVGEEIALAGFSGGDRNVTLASIRALKKERDEARTKRLETLANVADERDALREDLKEVTRERNEAQEACSRWTEIMTDELAESRRLMDLGGAREGENFTAFAERVIAERNALGAEAAALRSYGNKDCTAMADEFLRGHAS